MNPAPLAVQLKYVYRGILKIFISGPFGHLQFNQISGPTGPAAEVRVDGWNHLQNSAREEFIEEISDHCAIYCELQ